MSIAEVLAQFGHPPRGFTPTVLSCAHCDDRDVLDLRVGVTRFRTEFVYMRGYVRVPYTVMPDDNAARAWLMKHADCERLAEDERVRRALWA